MISHILHRHCARITERYKRRDVGELNIWLVASSSLSHMTFSYGSNWKQTFLNTILELIVLKPAIPQDIEEYCLKWLLKWWNPSEISFICLSEKNGRHLDWHIIDIYLIKKI